MVQPKASAADGFEAGYDFVGAQRFRAAKLDCFPHCRGMSQRNRANLRHIAVRNPANWTRTWPVDARLGIFVIKSQSRAQPYFHKPTGLNYGKVQALHGFLDLLLRITQRERYSRRPPKRDKQKPIHVCVPSGVHEVQLSLSVY